MVTSCPTLVKEHRDYKIKLTSATSWLLVAMSSKGYFTCTISQTGEWVIMEFNVATGIFHPFATITDRIVHIYYTRGAALAGMRNSLMDLSGGIDLTTYCTISGCSTTELGHTSIYNVLHLSCIYTTANITSKHFLGGQETKGRKCCI